jgi:hypothetical protein
METVNTRDIFFGLQEYLKFKGTEDGIDNIKDFIKILDNDDMEGALLEYCVKGLIKQYESDKNFRSILDFKKKINHDIIYDAMSISQVKSAIWLVEELSKLDTAENRKQGIFPLKGAVMSDVLVMAGWFGQLKNIYDKKLTYRKMRILDVDKKSCEASDYIFNLSELKDYKVKAINADINKLVLYKNGYEWDVENFKENTSYSEKFLPNLIINTHAEHMTEEWFTQIRYKNMDSDPVIAIQSNNLFDREDHVNCVHSVDHMKKKFPMNTVLYEGELQLKGYKRIMLIGKI